MMTKTLQERIQEKILILDGAMGTMIQRLSLTPADFGGEEYEGCNEYLVLTRPDVILDIHREYLQAGADIIETDTFGATSVVLAEYGLQHLAREINMAAVKLAKAACAEYSTSDHPRYVAGSIGPTTKTLSVTGGISFDELQAAYFEQALALVEAGADVLLVETAQDMLNVKAATTAIQAAFAALHTKIPVMVSGTIEAMGTTLAGQNIESFYIAIEHLHPLSVGINCATGPELMKDHVRTLSELSLTGVSCYPNAGMPDEEGHYHESPESFSRKMLDFANKGWLNIAGGCCGTTPDHTRALAITLSGVSPRKPVATHTPALAGIEPLFIEGDIRPVLIGERTNVIGSRKFKRLIADGKYEEAAEVARAQVKKGAHLIDVCLADPDRDEVIDMDRFLSYATKMVKVPFMIDSTDPAVVELGLKHMQGKSIINSINLEDGEKRFEEIVPLIKNYGASVVVGLIDETGMAVSAARKMEVARRSYQLLTEKYGLDPADIIFDPLVFPVGTGDVNYYGSANATMEAIRHIKEEFPRSFTVAGVSNVSFGLPPAGREVLNAVYLYHATKAGLDFAIVNAEKLERYASIPEMERELSEKILFQTDEQAVADFTAHFREKKVEQVETNRELLPLPERLAKHVIEGSKEGLIADLEEALATSAPLDIINGPLMDGMAEVGRLFNRNELIVAEVLQSAEVMKAAVAHLEPHMEKSESAGKGKILLATVKGDVHDIGKNLVDIILSNNGFEVINLGIKVPPDELIKAYKEHQPDALGLSGLLVKSAQQMVITAADLKAAGIAVPLFVGGAALTKKFTDTKIAPAYDGPVLYAKDAMEGLNLANRLATGELEKSSILDEVANPSSASVDAKSNSSDKEPNRADSEITSDAPVMTPPDLDRHVLRNYPIDQLVPYLNWQMLLGKHLGLRGNIEKKLQEQDEQAVSYQQMILDLVRQAKADGVLEAHAVYQFFPAKAKENEVLIYRDPNGKQIRERLVFPRQRKAPHLCLSDFLRQTDSDTMDYTAMVVVTTGQNIRAYSEKLKAEGHFLQSHAIQALALELAEAFAERLHSILRDRWGFSDPLEMTMRERFLAKYQGIRVSFGYPACPNLDDQAILFRLLEPQTIGVELTDGFMMEPEASVSAMVFAHPEARYFNVNAEDDIMNQQ